MCPHQSPLYVCPHQYVPRICVPIIVSPTFVFPIRVFPASLLPSVSPLAVGQIKCTSWRDLALGPDFGLPSCILNTGGLPLGTSPIYIMLSIYWMNAKHSLIGRGIQKLTSCVQNPGGSYFAWDPEAGHWSTSIYFSGFWGGGELVSQVWYLHTNAGNSIAS